MNNIQFGFLVIAFGAMFAVGYSLNSKIDSLQHQISVINKPVAKAESNNADWTPFETVKEIVLEADWTPFKTVKEIVLEKGVSNE